MGWENPAWAREGFEQHDSEADDRHRRDPRGALGLTACGTNRNEAGGSGGGSTCDTSKGTLVIGMVAPLSGSLSALGLGMRNSAKMAVDQANQKCTVKGYKLAFQPEDDQATAQIAGQAGTKLASDPNVVGVVGTLNSSTSQTVAPILAGKNIVQISPANTNPTLTLGDNPVQSPKRPFPTYFRVATTDLVQGPFGAQYLVQKAGKKNIAVIDDGKTYGAGLADQAAQEITEAGREGRRAREGRREGHRLLRRHRQGPAEQPGRRLLRR